MLISDDGTVKLSGFQVIGPLEQRRLMGDASKYRSPEMYNGTVCMKSDVWSLGISLIEMADGRNPYTGCSSTELMNQVVNQPSPSLTSPGWSSYLVDFVSECLKKDVNERASVDELLMVSPFEFM